MAECLPTFRTCCSKPSDAMALEIRLKKNERTAILTKKKWDRSDVWIGRQQVWKWGQNILAADLDLFSSLWRTGQLTACAYRMHGRMLAHFADLLLKAIWCHGSRNLAEEKRKNGDSNEKKMGPIWRLDRSPACLKVRPKSLFSRTWPLLSSIKLAN